MRTSPMLLRTSPSMILHQGVGCMQRQAKKHALFCVTELNVHVGVGGVEAACVRCMRDKKAIKGVAVAGAMKMKGGGAPLYSWLHFTFTITVVPIKLIK